MICPIDADTTKNKSMCGEVGFGWCTRLKGHKGQHHAHKGKGKCIGVWE